MRNRKKRKLEHVVFRTGPVYELKDLDNTTEVFREKSVGLLVLLSRNSFFYRGVTRFELLTDAEFVRNKNVFTADSPLARKLNNKMNYMSLCFNHLGNRVKSVCKELEGKYFEDHDRLVSTNMQVHKVRRDDVPVDPFNLDSELDDSPLGWSSFVISNRSVRLLGRHHTRIEAAIFQDLATLVINGSSVYKSRVLKHCPIKHINFLEILETEFVGSILAKEFLFLVSNCTNSQAFYKPSETLRFEPILSKDEQQDEVQAVTKPVNVSYSWNVATFGEDRELKNMAADIIQLKLMLSLVKPLYKQRRYQEVIDILTIGHSLIKFGRSSVEESEPRAKNITRWIKYQFRYGISSMYHLGRNVDDLIASMKKEPLFIFRQPNFECRVTALEILSLIHSNSNFHFDDILMTIESPSIDSSSDQKSSDYFCLMVLKAKLELLEHTYGPALFTLKSLLVLFQWPEYFDVREYLGLYFWCFQRINEDAVFDDCPVFIEVAKRFRINPFSVVAKASTLQSLSFHQEIGYYNIDFLRYRTFSLKHDSVDDTTDEE